MGTTDFEIAGGGFRPLVKDVGTTRLSKRTTVLENNLSRSPTNNMRSRVALSLTGKKLSSCNHLTCRITSQELSHSYTYDFLLTLTIQHLQNCLTIKVESGCMFSQLYLQPCLNNFVTEPPITTCVTP